MLTYSNVYDIISTRGKYSLQIKNNMKEGIEMNNILTPKKIKEQLDNYIIGQNQAKIALSIEIFKHYLKIRNKYELLDNNKTISKSNILMTGLTGCGKTLLAETLAKILDVPFAIADATTLTQAGYVGDDVENILLKLVQSADYDIERAEKGIIYIDEIDKIARKGENVSITRDVSGEGVQQALLKILEGTISRIPPQGGRKRPQEDCIELDTKNILFIAGGSFENVEDIVKQRLNTKNNIGFSVNIQNNKKDMTLKELRNNISMSDLKKFGMMPELLGRFNILTNLEPLELNDLVNILKLKTGYIEEFKTIFKLQNKNLVFQKSSYEEIAKIALKENLGARGLKYIIEKIMSNIMFNAPSEDVKEYIVNKEIITKNYYEEQKISA